MVLFGVVSDLGTYPEWLDIVPIAEPAQAVDDDAGPAWTVDLRGQIGPLRRSKRLRMVRSTMDAAELVVFERRELGGANHGKWVLEARVEPSGAGSSRLRMHLHYDGSLWVPLLDRILADEIERSRGRLLALLASSR